MEKFPISIQQGRRKSGAVIIPVLICIIVIVVISHTLFNAAYAKVYIVGSSMENTLTGAGNSVESGGDYVYVKRGAAPDYGDIVVIDVSYLGAEHSSGKNIIKRVIALGGDTVELKKGVLYLNGEKKDEPYVSTSNNWSWLSVNTFSELTVPEGYMFCMGDNRNVSEDSRGLYGCIPVSSTVGVVPDWSLDCKDFITAWNTFFDFRLSGVFSGCN